MRTAIESRELTEYNRISKHPQYKLIQQIIDTAIWKELDTAIFYSNIDDEMFNYLENKGYQIVKERDKQDKVITIIYW